MNRWIDTHSHIFAKRSGADFAFNISESGEICNAENYLKLWGDNAPKYVVVADFSKGRDSSHVIHALEDFAGIGMHAKGIIKANPFDSRTTKWLERDDIAGVRLYALASCPDLSEHKEFWDNTFNLMRRNNQHILVFGVGDYLLQLIEQLPADIPLLIDHLGMPDVFKGYNDKNHNILLSKLKARKAQCGAESFIKGPGYRTSTHISKVVPFIEKIVDKLGTESLIMGASDTPFLGPVTGYAPEYSGKNYPDIMTAAKVQRFIETLIEESASRIGIKKDEFADQVLYRNASSIYDFNTDIRDSKNGRT